MNWKKNIYKSLMIPCTFIVSSASAQPTTANLIEVAQFGREQAVGVTFSKKNRLFVTFPRQNGGRIFTNALVEIINNKKIAYPDTTWNNFDIKNPESSLLNAHAVIAQGNNLWVLDSAGEMEGLNESKRAKLLRINLSTNKVERVYGFKDLPVGKTQLNDVRIDDKRNLAYISDPRSASIVILDLDSGKSRLVLTHDKSTLADANYKLNIDGRDVISPKGVPFSSNVNGIALTHDGKWFYYRAINQRHLYRIETRYLADKSLDNASLAKHIEDVGDVGISHGMIADANGNIYLSDSVNYAINVVTPQGVVTRLVQDKRLSWPDTFAINSKGKLHVTAAQINRSLNFNEKDQTDFPYRLYKIENTEAP